MDRSPAGGPILSYVDQAHADRCRVVALLGLGGIGKTALAARLAQHLAAQFTYVLWRSLRNALPFEEWLGSAVGVLSGQQQTTLPEGLDARLALLLGRLPSPSCARCARIVAMNGWISPG